MKLLISFTTVLLLVLQGMGVVYVPKSYIALYLLVVLGIWLLPKNTKKGKRRV